MTTLFMATKQDIERISLFLADYMDSSSAEDWDVYIKEFMRTPLNGTEYAKVRENAREIVKGRRTPVMDAMKDSK
jgi:hypothetical protein